MVTGWRSEIEPDASVYNAMCAVEWHRPAGEIEACGGDMLIRSRAWAQLGGMNEAVIAAEDDELCVRLRKAGWTLWRLPVGMTRHDAAMTHFAQWWQRAVRTGHGFAQVGDLHPEYFRRERVRSWVWAVFVPAFLLATFISPVVPLLVIATYTASWWRTAQGLQEREGLPPGKARHQALFLTLSKFPNFLGMLTYYLRRRRGQDMQIIEYK